MVRVGFVNYFIHLYPLIIIFNDNTCSFCIILNIIHNDPVLLPQGTLYSSTQSPTHPLRSFHETIMETINGQSDIITRLLSAKHCEHYYLNLTETAVPMSRVANNHSVRSLTGIVSVGVSDTIGNKGKTFIHF